MERDINTLGSIHQNHNNGLWCAEINFKGRRYKNNGTVKRENCELWLMRKREEIARYEEERKEKEEELIATNTRRQTIYLGRFHKEYGLRGSIYQEIKRAGGKHLSDSVTYTAEINYNGLCYRKSSKDKSQCEEWLDGISSVMNRIFSEALRKEKEEIDRINVLIDESNRIRKSIKKEAKEKMQEAVNQYKLIRKENGEAIEHSSFSYTYIMIDKSNGTYKIGKSKNPSKRMASMTNQNIAIVAVYPADIEKMLHIRFMSKLIHGEWFALDNNDIEQLIREGFERVF